MPSKPKKTGAPDPSLAPMPPLDLAEPLADLEASLNDSAEEDLPPEPVVGGVPTPDFGDATTTPGRASSPRLWAGAQLHKEAQQLQVYRRVNGVPQSLGVIDADADEADLIRAFPAAMPTPGEGRSTFVLRPVNEAGRPVGKEVVHHVDEHHALLRARRGGGGDGVAGVAVLGAGAAEHLTVISDLAQRALRAAEERAGALERELLEERKRLAERDRKLAEEQGGLAREAVATVQTLTDRALESERQRSERWEREQAATHERANKQVGDLFGQQMAFLGHQAQERESVFSRERQEREDARRRDRDEEDARRKRDRDEEDARRAREQTEADRRDRIRQDETKEREARLEREANEREQDRQRQHELRLKEMDLSEQRAQAHYERMAAVQRDALAARETAGAQAQLGGVVKQAADYLRGLGVEPKELVARLLGDGTGGWLGLGEKVVDKAGDLMEEAMRARTVQAAARIQSKRLRKLAMDTDDDDEEEEDEENERDERESDDDSAESEGERGAAPPKPTPTTSAPPQAVPAPEGSSGGGLPLPAVREARGAVRALVLRLRENAQEQWVTLVAQALATTPAVYHYARQVGLKRALEEASALDLHAPLATLMKQSPLVPTDFRYE